MLSSREKRMQRWARTRAKGRKRFIVIYGVLGWGISTAISMSVFMWLITPTFNPYITIPLSVVIFSLGGILWGRNMWRESEKVFLSAHENHAS